MKKITWLLLFVSGLAFANYDNKPISTVKGGTGTSSQSNNVVVTTNGSGNLVSTSLTTSTEIGYVHGVTSALQTQINGLANTSLSNISSPALNVSLLPASSGSANLGSASFPFGTDFANFFELMGSTSGNVQLKAAATTSPYVITFPAAVCSSGQYWADNGSGVMSCTTPASAGANTSLSNLSAVAINTSLLPASALSANLGSAALPFGTDFTGDLELLGSTSGNVQVKASATTSSYTVTLPSAVCSAGQYWADNGSGVMSCTTLVSPKPTVVNGGDTAYTILANDAHIRSTTTLTANRTYTLPICNASNIGELHEIKNVQGQTFNITVAAAGSDVIDNAATYVLSPGDSVPLICAAFGTNGFWDIR